MRLDRPIGIWLLLWPTLWSLWIAAQGRPRPEVFLVLVLGVAVMRSAGCVINDYADRDFDPHVARTRDRPLAAGLVAPTEALVLFAALCLIAIALVLTLDPLAQLLAIVGAALTIVYPFTKRFFAAPQLVLGAAFGWYTDGLRRADRPGATPAWLMADGRGRYLRHHVRHSGSRDDLLWGQVHRDPIRHGGCLHRQR
jgi:4-hydroxybenzoate polyprenyltransferase